MAGSGRDFAELVSSIVEDAKRRIIDERQAMEAARGRGESRGGAIRVEADGAGRIAELVIEPGALRYGRRGEVDVESLAADVRAATNDALAELRRVALRPAESGLPQLGVDLQRISDGLDRAFAQVTHDLARVRQR